MDINFEKPELIKMVIDTNNPLISKAIRQIFEEAKSEPNKIKKDIK